MEDSGRGHVSALRLGYQSWRRGAASDYGGKFDRILKAKMSIQYCVAATLARGAIEESNYHVLLDPEINGLASVTKLEPDAAFTAAYPRAQGTEAMVKSQRGIARTRMDHAVPATPEQMDARFRSACPNSEAIEHLIDKLELHNDVGALGGLAT